MTEDEFERDRQLLREQHKADLTPIAKAFNGFWPIVLGGESIDIRIGRQVSAFDAHYSPFMTMSLRPDGFIQVDLAGNLFCDPPIDAAGAAMLQEFGFSGPTVDSERFLQEESFGGNPNYQRLVSPDYNWDELSAELVELLVKVYQVGRHDQFAFVGPAKVYQVLSKIEEMEPAYFNMHAALPTYQFHEFWGRQCNIS